jgi:glycosyltransferase involved in cell wall biosynthesis
LESTIKSILEQNYPNIELMIIDGGSTDNSVEVIKKYQKYLSFWVSEKDRGQTHAINKGFKRATGEFVNWLNSDDMLPPGALNALSNGINKNPGADVFFGDYLAVDAKGQLLYARKSAPFMKKTLFWGRQLSSQPAVFFRRSLLENFGYLNENQQFCMDTEFWIRIAQKGASFKQIKHPLGITRAHGDAKTTRLQNVLHDEHKQIVRHYKGLKIFPVESWAENVSFTCMNRFWRFASAFNRMIFRGDFTFMNASKALKKIAREN